MKLNIKKISAVLTSGLMFGLTLGVAAAASMPAPFSSSTASGVAIVTGTGSGVDDTVAAQSINTYLATKVKATGVAPTGDAVMLEKASDKFNLGNNMTAFFTKIDESELSTILAKGVYTNDDHNDYDYTQEIALGAALQLVHFNNADFNDDKPIIGFDMNSGDLIMNYTLKFSPTDAAGVDSSWSGIVGSYMPILGQTYYVLDMTNTTGTNQKITLLNAAVSGELTTGESTTVTAGDKTYEVVLLFNDGTNVKLEVNGEATDSLQVGTTQKLSDGSYIGIKDAQSEGYAGGAAYVEFSIGSGKLVLENTKEVELNSDKLSDTKYVVANSADTLQNVVTSYITTVGYDVDSVVLEWKIDDDTWLAPGTELVLPGFESIKLSMEDFVTDKSEATNLKGDTNKFTIKTTVTDGPLNLEVFYLNSSSTGIEGLGKDSTHLLITSGASTTTATCGATGTSANAIQLNLSEATNDYFVVTWINGDDYETYAYELGAVDEDNSNATVLESMTGGSDITIDAVGEDESEGNVKFKLTYAQEKAPSKAKVLINITSTGSGAVYTDRIVTAEGLQIDLPIINATGAAVGQHQINLNATTYATAWTQTFIEEDKDAAIAAGKSFNATYGFTGTDGLEIASFANGVTVYETEDNSDLWVGYVQSDLATMVMHDKPTSGLNDLDVTYFGSQSYAKVYVSETGSVAGSAGSMIFTDAQKSSWETRDVVLVGGSCINSATAEALGVPENTCEAAFTAATSVGEGQYLIESVDGFMTGKIALVVAGYSEADTAAAASKLINQPESIDTAVGNKYIGIVGVGTESTLSKQ